VVSDTRKKKGGAERGLGFGWMGVSEWREGKKKRGVCEQML
jgi:hypothetical protein